MNIEELTDKQLLEEMLKRFNLVAQECKEELLDQRQLLTLEAKKGNVKGYRGFVAEFIFDKKDKFLELTIVE